MSDNPLRNSSLLKKITRAVEPSPEMEKPASKPNNTAISRFRSSASFPKITIAPMGNGNANYARYAKHKVKVDAVKPRVERVPTQEVVFDGPRVAKKEDLDIRAGELVHYNGFDTEIIIENGIRTIGNACFYNYRNIESFEMPDTVTTIKASAFDGCVSLKFIKLSKNLKHVEENAFSKCSSLESIEFGSNLAFLGYGVFKGCTSLKSISFDPDCPLENIDSEAFYGCTSLTEIKWPKDIHHVFESAIHGCPLSNSTRNALHSMLVYSPRRNAFVLKHLVESDSYRALPNRELSLNTAGNHAEAASSERLLGIQYGFDFHFSNLLDDSSNLPGVTQSQREKLSGGLYVEGNRLVDLDTGIKNLVIPEQIRFINENFACNCRELETVVIEGKIEVIEQNAFRELNKLREVRFKDDVIIIGKSSFLACTALESVIWEKGLRTIHQSAFGKCSALKAIQLPDNIQALGDNVFFDCELLEEVRLPDSCVSIGKGVFGNCKSLKKVHLPKRLKRIPAETFKRCYKVKKIEWPDACREDGLEYPIVEEKAFMKAIMDDCCERLILCNGIMRRERVNLLEEQPDGSFVMFKKEPVCHIERVPQLIMNATLNVAWELTILPERYKFQMNILKMCLSLANILTQNEKNENRAERLFAIHALRKIELVATNLPSSSTRLILPLAICETLFAIGGNGNNRQIQICNLLSMADNYVPAFEYEDMTVDETERINECVQNEFHNELLKLLCIGEETPFLYSPYVWRYALPIPPYNNGNIPSSPIVLKNHYYEMINGIHSMMTYQHHIAFAVYEDYSNDSPKTWLPKLGKAISDASNGMIHLVVFGLDKVFPKNVQKTIYYKKIKPTLSTCEHTVYDYVSLITQSQVDAVRDVLMNYQLEDMMIDYSSSAISNVQL